MNILLSIRTRRRRPCKYFLALGKGKRDYPVPKIEKIFLNLRCKFTNYFNKINDFLRKMLSLQRKQSNLGTGIYSFRQLFYLIYCRTYIR